MLETNTSFYRLSQALDSFLPFRLRLAFTRKPLFSEKETLKCSIYHTTCGFARTASMPSWLKRLILLLWTIAYCASCASVPQTCVQCSLSCDGEPTLEKHDRVIVSIKHPLQDIPDKVYNVSSLFDVGSCSVPGCFQRDALYILKIYANNDPVPEVLVDEPNLRPDCGPESVPVRKDPNGADGKHCNKLLILLAFCFWIFFHLEGQR